MGILKTYLLAPNFTTHLDGNVQLGTVIANPFRPNKWVGKGKIPLNIDVDTHTEYDRSISPGASASTHVNIFAKFLETASNVGLRTNKSVLNHYTMDALETVSYKRDISDDEAAEIVQADSKIQDVMNSGVLGAAPVYIVTGLKVAKGFRLNTELIKSNEVNFGASAPIIEQISAGADLGFSRGKVLNEQSSTTQDIIFAYQLHAIATKGWWKRKRVETNVYAPKAAALSRDDSIANADDTVATTDATVEEIEESLFDYDDISIDVHDVYEGDARCVCIAFRQIAE